MIAFSVMRNLGLVPLQIDHRELSPNTVLITLSGAVMRGSESQQVEDLVGQLLGQGCRDFIFELSGVTRIDSTGIGRFISSFDKINQAGGRLHMAGATGHVRECFRVTRLDTVFPFYPDVEAARGAVSR